MTSTRPRYSADEAGKRGDEIYARVVKRQVEPQQHGRIVAIDIESEEFVVDDSLCKPIEQGRLRSFPLRS